MSKISVIIPVYKVEKYLSRCVDSILAQTFKDYELILVDDGSPDNCPAMCDEYAKKYDFIKVIHQKNQGAAVARNTGIEYALSTDSEWIAFIDSDDWVHNQYLEVLYKTCVENNLKICCCEGICVKNHIIDKNLFDYSTIIASPEELFIDRLLIISTPCMGIYNKLLFSDKRFPYGKIHEDEFIMPMILYSNKQIGFIKENIYYYFQHTGSTTHREKSVQWIDNQLEAFLCQIEFFAENTFYETFNCRLRRFKLLVSEYYDNFGKKKNYKKILKNRIKQAKSVVKKYKTYIQCYDYKKLNFNKWVIGYYDKINVLKSDITDVRKQKGAVYARLWYIINFLKIKFKYL